MAAPSNGEASQTGSFGAQHTVPRDATELHDRTHAFLTAVAPTLNSIEDLLESWNRFRTASASADTLPPKSSFRSVHIDSFTVQEPPPAVSEAEVTQHIKKLSAKELKALHDEFQLTCLEDCEVIHPNENGHGWSTQTAAHMVHFAEEPTISNSHLGGSGETETVLHTVHQQPPPALPVDDSITTRARSFFETATAAAALHTAEAARPAAATTTAAPTQTPPAFSLEPMGPSAIAAHERRMQREATASYGSDEATEPTYHHIDAAEGCTVELEYSANHFLPTATQRALRGKAATAITITPSPHVERTDTARLAAHSDDASASSGSDVEADAAGTDIRSFTTFSRMALANHGRRLASRRAELETEAGLRTSTPQQPPRAAPAQPVTQSIGATAAPTAGPDHHPSSPSSPPAEVDTTAARDVFVRARVRDVLLANRVRADDAALLAAAFFAKLDAAWNAAADQTTPVLHKLDALLCESSALLHTLEIMDHQAYRERVADPAQYLCVPRYSAVCAAPDCSVAFSTTVTRVMCGRCGQFFCPKCCAERGMGPDVVCDGQRYSLGWEPLCRVCYSMCKESQEKMVEERTQYLRITQDPSGNASGAGANRTGGEDAQTNVTSAAAKDLTVKQAVLFGAYCDEQRCLSDGLPPFYVIHRSANESVAYWDILSYHVAKSKGSLRRSWQTAGSLASQAVHSAAEMLSNRRGLVRK